MNRRQQQGSMYSKLFLVFMVGVAVLVGLRAFPIYMDEFKARSAFEAVAASPEARTPGTPVGAHRWLGFAPPSLISTSPVHCVKEISAKALVASRSRSIARDSPSGVR